jgi:predicted phage terminase large subunit-like protein
MENISAADQAAIESARLELRLLQIEAQEKAQKDFLSFAKYVWPEGIFGAHHAKMADAFNRIADGTLKRLIVNMPPRHALARETRIPTTFGWKTIEQLGPRDLVFGPDGKPVKVLGKSEVFKDRELYRVTTDDGFSLVVDGEHLWTVRLSRTCKVYHTYKTEDLWKREQGVVLRTKRNGEVEFLESRMKSPRPPRLPDVLPVEYRTKRLPIDPYVLGVWLGDGTSRSGVITCAADDAVHMRKVFEERGYRTTDHACSVTFGVKGLQDKLRKLGVLQNKHIPLAYLQADVSQRRWLLKGLMDTDGTVGKRGQCVFCQSNYDFIVQVRELLCSLGIKNSLIELDAKIGEKNYGKTWRICFYAKDIAHLQRKEERTIKTALKNGRYIRVEKLGTTGDTQCIRVDREDGLFLAGEGFICTHNTKSEFSSYLLPAFIMGRQPKTKIIQATHTGELAVRFGRKVRNLMDTDEYKQVFSDVALRADSKAAGRWDTDHGGEYFACLRPYALVHTDRGQVPAGEIKQGDVLLNCGKAVTVQEVYHSKHKATYNIAGLDCSSNHPIWTMNRGWVYAADVVPTDILCAESIWNKARMLWKCKKADNTDITPSLLRGKNDLETYGVPKGIGTVRRKTAKLVGRIKNLFVQDLCGLLLGVRLAGHVSRTTHQDEGFINFLTDGDHTFFAEGVLTHNCGVGGAMTGRGADLLIIDDPHSEQDALSELAMDNAWEWYTSGPRQRLQPGGSVVVVMCMTGDTNVLMADGSTTKLKDIRPGDKVATYEEGSITTSKINNWKSNGVDSIYTITTQSGIILRANERHPFLVEIEGKRQWIRLRDLKKGMQLVATKDVSDLHDLRQSPDYALHAKHGNHITEKTLTPLTTLSDITGNGKEKNAGVENLYHQGDYVLLATGKNTNRLHGLLKKTEQLVLNTVMGSHLISMTKWLKSETIDVIYAAKSLLRKTQERIGMESCVLTTTMTQGPSEDCYATTATCPLGMEKHPKTSKEPLSIYSVITDKIADIKYTGEEEVFDIEVDRTENFIANGVISHNTRWNTKDLTARLVKAQTSHNADRWEVIEFPAILPSEKPMWPEFWKLEELLAVKASLSPQKWQAQWQQQPSNDEGAILKREWWRVWPSEEPPPVEYIIQSYDTAYSKKETADYSAITTWGVFYPDQDSGPNIILLDATKGRWDFPELKRIAKDQYDQWQPDNVLIEAKATGITLQQELRRMGIPVTMYSPGGRRAGQDKVSRAHSVAPLFEAGMVWAPDTDWAEDLVEECAAFPNGDKDDLVDSTVQCLMRFRTGNFLTLNTDDVEEEKQQDVAFEYY